MILTEDTTLFGCVKHEAKLIIYFVNNKSPKKYLIKSAQFFSPLFRRHAVAEVPLRHYNWRPPVIIKQVIPRHIDRNAE